MEWQMIRSAAHKAPGAPAGQVIVPNPAARPDPMLMKSYDAYKANVLFMAANRARVMLLPFEQYVERFAEAA
jgi:hypothetical protein